MKFGLRKCGILTLKRGKVVRSEGIELPNGEVMREVEQEGYTYLGIVGLDKVAENEIENKIIRAYKRMVRFILR